MLPSDRFLCILLADNHCSGKRPMKERKKIQKVLMGIAVVSYVASIVCAMAAAYLSDGTANPEAAGFMTSVVFFAGAGILLHVISSTSLPSLKVERERT